MNAYWLSKPSSFEEAFPTVKEIRIEVNQTGDGVADKNYPRTLVLNPPEKIACDNPRCNRGGFDLQNEIYFMVESLKVEKSIEKRCTGDEGKPKAKRPGKSCCNRFIIAIKITYHHRNTQV